MGMILVLIERSLIERSLFVDMANAGLPRVQERQSAPQSACFPFYLFSIETVRGREGFVLPGLTFVSEQNIPKKGKLEIIPF